MHNNFKDFFGPWKQGESKYLNHAEPTALKARATSTTVSAKASVLSKPFRIKLANESLPKGSESEDSRYDSFNEHETDYCQDSSDGYETEGIATMDVIEYELDDTSSSDSLYSLASSSGTDDFTLSLTAVARAIFDPSSGSDQFEIFADDADTEESDAPTDPELGRADYWTCIKCKNQKNNPMYRFCEKCYQVRKTLFPPRPKHKKKRRKNSERRLLKNVHKLPDSSASLSSTSSSSSSSCLSGSEEKLIGRISRNSSGDECDIGNLINSNSSKRLNVRNKTKQQSQNSAGDSSCCSSQELSPDEQQPSKSKYLDACPSSQETYCSEIERIVDQSKNTQVSSSSLDYPNSQESIYSVSQECDKSNAVKLVQISSTASSGFHSLSSQSEEHNKSDSCEINSDDMMSVNSNNNNNNINQRKGIKRKVETSGISSDNSEDEIFAKKIKGTHTTIDDDTPNGMCNICFTQPKNGAFVHAHRLHVYCCYRCAVKVWSKCKRCPVCNSQAKNVMKMFVH